MLIKSGIGRKSDQKQTLIGLGLTRVGKVRELEETTRRRKAIIEQNQQELAEHDGQFSWGELIDSDEHHSSTAGKGGLPRIDL